MRKIGSFELESIARTFVDYLLTLGVRASARGSSAPFDIWVENEEELERARAELKAYLENPDDPKYHAAARGAQDLRRKDQEDQELRRKNYVDVRTRWHLDQTGIQPLTATLIGISFLVGLLTKLGDQLDPYGFQLLFCGRTVGLDDEAWFTGLDAIKSGELWRLITPIFIHFDPLHILFNMLWLHSLGGMIERERGMATLGFLVAVTGVTGNCAQYWWHPWGIFGGMSGVNYGLFGYLWYVAAYDRNPRLYVSEETVRLMFVWLLVCMTGLVGPVANAAHLGGFASGYLLGILSVRWARWRGK